MSQKLRQEGEADCSVPVFRELAGISREELLRELPHAVGARVTVQQWEEWLYSKGRKPVRHQNDEPYTLPCAHLVEWAGRPHWIYQDQTGVHDPNPAFTCMPEDDSRLLTFEVYKQRILTISVTA
jgi:hypothetical protein